MAKTSSQPVPTNPALYARAKAEVYAKYSKPSAYRSLAVVKKFKSMGGKYSGSKTKGKLYAWEKQKWRNEHGKTGYQNKSDIYRPTKKFGKTPKLMSSISKKDMRRVRAEKARTGHVKKF